MSQKYFTDSEYRILLRALSREREVCEQVDKDCGEEHKLIRIMNSIERKIKSVQYPPKKECLKQTNGDKIRNMTNEELADFLSVNAFCDCCSIHDKCDAYQEDSCKNVFIKWLQSKAEE